MKPSERIKEAFKVKPHEVCSDNVYLLRAFEEIGNILDEIQCKHTSSYQVEGFGDVYYNVCNDCGVLVLASQLTKSD